MKNLIEPFANDIDAQIAALLATRAAVKLATRQNYRSHTRGPLLDAFKTLLSAGLNRRAAGAAIRAIEPTIAAVSVKTLASTNVIEAQYAEPVARPRKAQSPASLAAQISNLAFKTGSKWAIRPSDRIYAVDADSPKTPPLDGWYRFEIIRANPGITKAGFAAKMMEHFKLGRPWAAEAEVNVELHYDAKRGDIRLERD